MFTIVAEREGLQIYIRKNLPSDALKLAEDRIKSGAEKVSVFDGAGAFISASTLKRMAQEQAKVRLAQREVGVADPSAARPKRGQRSSESRTIRVGGSATEAKAEEPAATPAKSRVRVFKARKSP